MVEFRNNSLNATSFHWDFGDGNTSTERDPIHIYSEIGNYTVVLTAFLDDKSDQHSDIALVNRIFPENLTKLSTPPFGSNADGLSFTWNGRGYVAGGTSNFQFTHDLWEFDPTTITWKKLSDLPKEFSKAASFVIDGVVYMGLGQSPWGAGSREFYKYDIATDTYTSIGSMPISNNNGNQNWSDVVAFSFEDKGYIIGSTGLSGESIKVMEFNSTNDSWSEKSIYPGEASSGKFHFVLDGYAYVGMGNQWGFNGFDIRQEIYRYDIANNSWTQLADFPSGGRRDAGSFTYNGKGYICFGFNNDPFTGAINAFSGLWEYNVSTDEWTRIESMPISVNHHFYHFIFENKFYFGGGFGINNNSLSDFYEYEF